MEASASGDFAYFLDPGLNLLDYVKEGTDADPQIEENTLESLPNYFAQSESSNPFYFPPSGLQSFSSAIMGIATTTKALSQGQFGQYPLYVFTKDGIWALETNTDGSFATKKPLSRDVALSEDCITPIEQAIIFTTDQGVMFLSGSDIKNISPFMLGKHYSIDDECAALIDKSVAFSGIIERDATPFMEFMRNAKCAYDYTGQRLIFINDHWSYKYIYKINTNTWHKMHEATEDYWSTVFVDKILESSAIPAVPTSTSSDTERANYRSFIEAIRTQLPNIADAPAFHRALVEMKNGERSLVLYRYCRNSEVDGYKDELNDFEFNSLQIFQAESEMYCDGTLVLNSYPDCHIALGAKVFNYSATLETDGAVPLKGIIVTRPFDLEETDVRKVLKHIRIRGYFNRTNVQYILQASMDGINWGRVTSLRSASYKLFRMIILCDLEKDERISWVDVDYETRFNNKLR